MIRTVGGLIGCEAKADALATELESGLEAIRAKAAALPRRPRVYFEEWDEPMISAIRCSCPIPARCNAPASRAVLCWRLV